MDEIKIEDKTIERLKRKIILMESKNLKTRQKTDAQMVSDFKKLIEEDAQCYFNR